MPKRVLPLSDLQLRNAKPKDKNYKLPDGHGLYLFITTQGGKLWRLDYRFKEKRKTLTFGRYPYVTLVEARRRRDEALTLLANGIDPSEDKKAKREEEIKQQRTFETVANDWLKHNSPGWSESHIKDAT